MKDKRDKRDKVGWMAASTSSEVESPGHRQAYAQQRPSWPHKHGVKRHADNALETEQRLSKRLDLLNLDNGTRLYMPVSGSLDAAPPAAVPPPRPVVSAIDTNAKKKSDKRPRPRPSDDMEVEDTPNRVYINDLAAELSDVESDEENPIFLSDIEKHLLKIPQFILTGPDPKPREDNQLILYNVPSSLTVPEEEDSVRKAIVEARARLREKQALPYGEPDTVSVNGNTAVTGPARPGLVSEAPSMIDDDPDAMDIDDY